MAITTDTTYANAYRADNLGDVKPSILIGGKTKKFVPNTNISYKLESSQEQFYININRKSVTVDKESQSFASEKIALTIGNETDIWHINEKGEFEWDIEFKEKPPTNIFTWDLLYTEGLQFYYQRPLTQEEIDSGRYIQPERVAGSYAVYCDKTGHYKDAQGNTIINYATGKLMHIYRPLCTDAKGSQTWAELLIEKNTLTITIPQKYLDSAEYPVTLDPTFGNTAHGAGGYGFDVNSLLGVVASAPDSSGTGDSISAWFAYCEGTNVKGVLLNHDSGDVLVSNGVGNATASGSIESDTLITSAFGTGPTITSGTVYYPCILVDGTSTYISYDYTGIDWPDDWYGRVDTTNSYATPESPGSLTVSDNRYSIYCTYTAGGGGSTIWKSQRRKFQHLVVR